MIFRKWTVVQVKTECHAPACTFMSCLVCSGNSGQLGNRGNRKKRKRSKDKKNPGNCKAYSQSKHAVISKLKEITTLCENVGEKTEVDIAKYLPQIVQLLNAFSSEVDSNVSSMHLQNAKSVPGRSIKAQQRLDGGVYNYNCYAISTPPNACNCMCMCVRVIIRYCEC